MRLKMKARQEVTAVTAGQYRGASKKQKREILDQFVSTTGYSRWYARLLLRHEGRRIQADKQTILLAVRSGSGGGVRKRARLYDEKVLTALLKLWRLMDYICGEQLRSAARCAIQLNKRDGTKRATSKTNPFLRTRGDIRPDPAARFDSNPCKYLTAWLDVIGPQCPEISNVRTSALPSSRNPHSFRYTSLN